MARVFVSFVIVQLAILISMTGTSTSAPVQTERGKRDVNVEAATDRLINALRLKFLMDKKSVAKAAMSDRVMEQDSGTWKYPPLSDMETQEVDEDDLTPGEKAARRHFEISEPGTGPVLNHPLNNDNVKVDKKTVLALIDQLLTVVE